MRIFVMFDLPTETASQRKEYRVFRRYLIKNGFIMLQESIYSKLANNSSSGETIVDGVKKNKPKEGLVQILKITEKQYSKMESIVGSVKSDVLNNDERLIIL